MKKNTKNNTVKIKESNNKRDTIIIILVIILVLSIFGVIVGYYIKKNGDNAQDNTAESTPESSSTPAPLSVTNLETTLYVFQEEKKCLFTGEIDLEGRAVGKGHYEIFNDDGTTWTFNGVTYNKNVWDGRAMNYPMKYGNDDVQYSCLYTGSLKSGIPNGDGTLRVEGTDGEDFTYSGNWKDGLYDGYGELIYDDSQNISNIGNFEKGVYKPTFIQLSDLLFDACLTTISDTDKAYLESVENNVLQHDAEGLNFGNGFDFSKYIKDSKNEDNRWFKTRITIVNAVEYPESIFGIPFTEIAGYSNGGKYVFHGFYFGLSDKLAEDKVVEITGYPVGYGKFNSSTDLEAISFIACTVAE